MYTPALPQVIETSHHTHCYRLYTYNLYDVCIIWLFLVKLAFEHLKFTYNIIMFIGSNSVVALIGHVIF